MNVILTSNPSEFDFLGLTEVLEQNIVLVSQAATQWLEPRYSWCSAERKYKDKSDTKRELRKISSQEKVSKPPS